MSPSDYQQSLQSVKTMVQRHEIKGYESFKEFMQQLKVDNGISVNILFSGAKDPVTRESWCSDCVESEPHIEKAILEHAPKDSILIKVDVGDRATWKNPDCPFRHDRSIGKLTVIPTLLRWKGPQRLEGVDQCAKADLLEMFFTDDDN